MLPTVSAACDPSWVNPRHQSGQALVEAALTLPLVLFTLLGTMQLFMMLQARMLADYAVFRATRAGAVAHGRCPRMKHAAIAALLPAFTRTVSLTGSDHAQVLGAAFGARRDGKFNAALDQGHDGDIVWMFRERPGPGDLPRLTADTFDVPISVAQTVAGVEPVRLEVRMIFWYPMRIPFAGPLMTRMFLAMYGLRAPTGINPLMVARKVSWDAELATLESSIGAEMLSRAGREQYAFPIQATHAMRMMSPAYARDFAAARCP
jgi:hypothetical protein